MGTVFTGNTKKLLHWISWKLSDKNFLKNEQQMNRVA